MSTKGLPLPHECEHAPHAPNASMTQSTGHAAALHDLDSPMCGHSAPPCSAATSCDRLRLDTPPPHDFEHVLHAPNELTMQSDGQLWALQDCDEPSDGHALPPMKVDVVTTRLRCCIPPPQLKEHVPQVPHEPTMQSTGHEIFTLHTLLPVNVGHAPPPCRFVCTTLRERCWSPPAHDREQPDQELQLLITQCTGHGCEPHTCVSEKSGQDFPPAAMATTKLRVRMLKPPPQVREHADQALKEVTSQSTGQKWILHALFSCRCLHAMPPFAGCCVMVRLRVVVPPPQDREH